MKVPQVFISKSLFNPGFKKVMTEPFCKVLRARSARGLSFAAYILETLAYAITLAYSYRNAFPFSTYGENFFLTIQNALITVLIAYYPSSGTRRARGGNLGSAFGTLIATIAGAFALYSVPSSTLSLLQLATLPLSLFSKLPQITSNYRAQSTGQLSAFAVASQVLGCLARVFTTLTEVDDVLLLTGFVLALVLNCVLAAQMWMYWGQDSEMKSVDIGKPSASEKFRTIDQTQVDIVVPPASPSGQRYSSPSGRRWARKVD